MDKAILKKNWHPTKNGSLTLEQIPPQSSKKIWWLGECGHEWEMSMYQVSQITGNPCPYCRNRKVLGGFNDVATTHPHLVTEWQDNNIVKPTSVSASSTTKINWSCEKNHEWEATIKSRAILNSGCPVCAGKRILSGFNDLFTLAPAVVTEWHPTKNGAKKPEQYGIGSQEKVWWLGECGHEWEATIHNRTRKTNPSGCPVCWGNKIVPGVNDFATIFPLKANLWHPTKNSAPPTGLPPHSKIIVWWLEPCGHEYQMSIFARIKALSCQVCSNRIVIPGVNDLATTHPSLIPEWHPFLNKTQSIYSVTAGQPQKVWWQCQLKHEWQASPNDRIRYSTKCPICSNQKVLEGFNDLTTLHPEVASQWNFKRNVFAPHQVTSGADLKVWWVCKLGHEWEAAIYSRTSPTHPTGCPFCSKNRVTPGVNDLATTQPEITVEWHPTKNIFTPSQVSEFSNMKTWWMCEQGHEWEASIHNRSAGKKCPKCSASQRSSKAEKEIFTHLTNLGVHVIPTDRDTLQGIELDMYIPDRNVAIEYNGLYWHSEAAGKTKNYHHQKYSACKQKGIQLIQVWEDDWNRNPELILTMLENKLHLTTGEKLYARNLIVARIVSHEAQPFLEANHIQGWVSSSYYYALKTSSNEIVAVLSLKQEKQNNKIYNLTRYATNHNVLGGFTKLLTYAEKELSPTKIITFSDNSVSLGALYEKNGFILEKHLKPDYSYFSSKTKKREHKFLYRLKRFRTDPELFYQEGFTESQLADINKLYRVWDSGKIRWVKTYN